MSSILRGNDNPPDTEQHSGWVYLGFIVTMIIAGAMILWLK